MSMGEDTRRIPAPREPLHAVIVAAGASRRAGFDKLAAPLCGVSVLCRSIEAFAEAGAAHIVVVASRERWDAAGVGTLSLPCPLVRVDGGAERQDSVASGLAALPSCCRWVAVHDGARPLIRPADILRCFEAARRCGAAACAHPVADTLKRADDGAFTLPGAVSRECLWGMETPQIFDVGILRRAGAYVRREGVRVTDEVSAVEAVGVRTALIPGGCNVKITWPGDLALAEAVWRHEHR